MAWHTEPAPTYEGPVQVDEQTTRMLIDALTDAREFIATTCAMVGDGSRISELVEDFDYALAKARGEPA